MQCKIRIIKEIAGLYPQYRLKVGGIYDALYRESNSKNTKVPAICVVDILGAKIMVRKGEYEIVGDSGA